MLSGGERFAVQPGLVSRLIAPGFRTIIDRIDRGLEKGSMLAHLPDGTSRMLGGRNPGFEAELTLHDWRALIRLATSGSVGWYQAYEAGEWSAADMVTLFAVMGDNVRTLGNAARSSGPFKWLARLAHWLNRNNRAGSARNISAHYDLGNDFYAAWLDPSMAYSSGFAWGEDGLEGAQKRKFDAISRRLGPAKTVLEIGCGWGGLARHIASTGASTGAEVTAISLSDQQLAFARADNPAHITFRKQDYRDVEGAYDGIASVEMVEALGREYWPEFMDCVARNLTCGGKAALQYIAMDDDLFEAYAGTVDFIQAHVFPGGLLIKTSEFRALAEARGLSWRDQTDFGLDYAETLKAWRRNFDQAVEAGRLPPGFDERFVRLWRFYLDYCEGGFRAGNINVHQVTLVKN